MNSPNALPLLLGAIFGVCSVGLGWLARRLARERRYELYGMSCVFISASVGCVAAALAPAHSRWDPWILGLYLMGMVAALWMFRRGRRIRAWASDAHAGGEIAAPPSNDR